MLNFNTYVQPIRLGAIKLGDFVTAVGWGYTNEYGPLSNTLLKITVPVLPNTDCNVHDAYNGKITSNMLCAGYLGLSGYDSCQGDSGGPLTVGTGKNATLVGIASWGEGEIRHSIISSTILDAITMIATTINDIAGVFFFLLRNQISNNQPIIFPLILVSNFA